LVASTALGLETCAGGAPRQQRDAGLAFNLGASDLGAFLPVAIAVLLPVMGLKIPVANAWALIRLMGSWSVVTVTFDSAVSTTGASRPMLQRAASIVGHVALIPSISAPNLGLSEASKAAGFVLALLLGFAVRWAIATALHRPECVEGGGTSKEREARTLQAQRCAERVAAEAKQKVVGLETELASARSMVQELQTTCNALVPAISAAKDRQQQLCEFVKTIVPQDLWPDDVRQAIEDDEASDEDTDEECPASDEHPWPAGRVGVRSERQRATVTIATTRPARSPAPMRPGAHAESAH